jgi:hypothetical protein
MKLFRILTTKQLNQLTEEDRTAYDEALAPFVEEFQNTYPEGLEFTAKLREMRGGNRFSDNGSITIFGNKEVTDTLGNRFILPEAVMDLFASNSGFFNAQHMVMSVEDFTVKGEVKGRITLRVEGDEWENKKKGTSGLVTKTHYVTSFEEYLPSPAVAQARHESKKATISKGHDARMFGFGTSSAAQAQTKVAEQPEPEMPNPADDAEDTDV